MTPFTLVMAYYENAGMLREQARQWLDLPEDIAKGLHVRIVDDGSPNAPALDAVSLMADVLRRYLASVEVWRMGVDVRWNQDACRNVGVREAPAPWLLLTDMDHVVPVETWRELMTTKLKKERAYRLARVNAPALDPYKPHPNSWVIHSRLYWQAGGYDEALAGFYGTDGDFKVRLQRVAEIHDLPHPLIRYPREVIPDASTTTLERKSERDRVAINGMIKSRNLATWKPRHFSFPCTRVL